MHWAEYSSFYNFSKNIQSSSVSLFSCKNENPNILALCDMLQVRLPRIIKVTVEWKSSNVRSKYASLKIHNKLIIIHSKFC